MSFEKSLRSFLGDDDAASMAGLDEGEREAAKRVVRGLRAGAVRFFAARCVREVTERAGCSLSSVSWDGDVIRVELRLPAVLPDCIIVDLEVDGDGES